MIYNNICTNLIRIPYNQKIQVPGIQGLGQRPTFEYLKIRVRIPDYEHL